MRNVDTNLERGMTALIFLKEGPMCFSSLFNKTV